jgi:hypothetical protein
MRQAEPHGAVPVARPEREALEHLRELAAQHPRGQRPGIRAAAAMLLETDADVPPDGVPLPLNGRSLRLLPRRVFNATGRGTGAVELFALQDEDKGTVTGRLIRKRIHRTALDVSNIRWLTEALFYLDAAPQIACEGIRFPALHGCRTGEDSVILVMEFLGNKPASLPALELLRSSARAVGLLGGFTHLHQVYEKPWMERVTHRLKPEALLALQYLVLECLPGAEGEHCLAAIEGFIDTPQLHHSMAEQGMACLVHGDLHLRNMLPLADGTIGLIDWSHVGRGLIGEDLARLLLPTFVVHPAHVIHTDFGAAVDWMTAEVVAGAKSFIPALDARKVDIAVTRALMFATVNVAGQNPEGWKQRLAGGDQEFRVRLQSVFRYAAATANQLMARFGG